MAGSPIGGSINQQAAGAIQGAGLGAVNEMMQPVGQIASANLAAYQNPYNQQVIDASMGDLERQRQMQMNTMGGQASTAGAFGGSRHGVAEALTNEGFARQGGQLAANLRQSGFTNAQNMAQQDIQNRLAGSTQRLAAGSQLGSVANLGFNMGQTVNENLMKQGLSQQAMQQALIDSAKQQFTGYTNAPGQSLSYMTSALGATPVPQGQTTSSSPGIFDYLTTGAALYGASDIRLKTSITKIKDVDGVNVYAWQWNDKAREIGVSDQPTVGVMAQEIALTHPQAVVVGDDGFLRVKYNELPEGVRRG